MRVRGESEPLGNAAGFAARHTAGRAVSVPALTGLRIRADDTGVTLAGYDYEASSTVTLELDVLEPGEVLLPGRVFAQVVQALPPGPVDVRVRDNSVEVTADGIDFAFPTLPLEDYPELPAAPPPQGFVAAEPFTQAAMRAAKVAARDDAVPILSGTLVEFGSDTLTLTSSDRYRISIQELAWQTLPEGADDDQSVAGGRPASDDQLVGRPRAVVPARLLAEAVKGLDPKADLRIGLHTGADALLGLADERRTTTMRLLDGTYPALRSKLPREFSGAVTMGIDDLRSALRRVCLVADRYAAVVLTIRDGEVAVGAAGDVDIRGREVISARLEGSETTTPFNASYLLDGLDSLDTAFIRLSFQDGIRPALLTGRESPTGDDRDDIRYVAMPRRLPT